MIAPRLFCRLLLAASLLAVVAAQAQTAKPKWARYSLRAEQTWQLDLPQDRRFDASGLLLSADGSLFTLNDRGAALYRISFCSGEHSAGLVLLSNVFTQTQLAPWAAEKTGRYDCEGIACDEQGRLYVCEEADRWVLRCDPANGRVERLDIDWTPVQKYFSRDRNASFEGIAIGGGKLYLANERETARIIVVDLKTLKVIDHFKVFPRGRAAIDLNYSDLSWFDGALFVLLRESYMVLKVDPTTHEVVTEYDYRQVENAPSVAYHKKYPTGTMEGLAVDRDYIWLVTDNN
ncbi:MAG: esterase-like activity of phytase family protein, partial [Pedosphaera parvula]|nr:esterase-like activity of phytase family protein [Pedosphaera parvula]